LSAASRPDCALGPLLEPVDEQREPPVLDDRAQLGGGGADCRRQRRLASSLAVEHRTGAATLVLHLAEPVEVESSRSRSSSGQYCRSMVLRILDEGVETLLGAELELADQVCLRTA
jgi:hypothetical protein